MDSISDFPPKVIRISDAELEWRRKLLERYLHCLCQEKNISESSILINFLRAAQKVSASKYIPEAMTTQLKVFLCNGKSKEFSCSQFDATSSILTAACDAIGIEKELACYFGIFLEYTKMDEENWKLLKVCSEYESPYISLQNASRSENLCFRISIRKWYFNKLFLEKLIGSKTCLNMLYIEGLCILEGVQQNEISQENIELLSTIKKSRKEFVEKINELAVSNEIVCSGLTLGEHKKNCIAILSGKYIIIMSPNENRHEGKLYPISKLRCWKIGVLRNSRDHFFAFEYEYEPQKFIWVTLRGISTILLTQCISKAVEEYILTANRMHPSLIVTKMDSSTKATQQLVPVSFVNGLPPGIDIEMTSNDISADNYSTSEENLDLHDVKVEDVQLKNDVESHTLDSSKCLASEEKPSSNTSLSSSNTVHSSIIKKKGAKKMNFKELDDGIVFNDTFLNDSDL